MTFERDFPQHPLHYANLVSMMLVGLWGLFWFNYSRTMQLSIATTMAIVYVTWGIIHHKQHNDLHLKIVAEYLLVALLAVLVYASLLYRA